MARLHVARAVADRRAVATTLATGREAQNEKPPPRLAVPLTDHCGPGRVNLVGLRLLGTGRILTVFRVLQVRETVGFFLVQAELEHRPSLPAIERVEMIEPRLDARLAASQVSQRIAVASATAVCL